MLIRPFDSDRDQAAVHRIWRECGWLTDEEQLRSVDALLSVRCHLVAELDGEAECSATATPGILRYLDDDLPFAMVPSVTTSRIARKQGFAGHTTARAVATEVGRGAVLAGLGAFEQGFYDRLGFGTGTYENMFEFDPKRLVLPPRRVRTPRRITPDMAAAVHASRNARRLVHGACRFHEEAVTEAGMHWTKRHFGVGFFDGPDGALSHHFWCSPRGDAEFGPVRVSWMAYETRDQLLELLTVLRNWGDQFRSVHVTEPPDVQFQSLLRTPTRITRMTEGSPFRQRQWFMAWWQMRICDLPRCVAATRVPGEPVAFNLVLDDPIGRFLPDDAPWRGVAGSYRVEFGPSSSATAGEDAALPTLRASVNAFTRLWLGVAPASGLAVSDDLDAPDELLARLDRVLRLPKPITDWDF